MSKTVTKRNAPALPVTPNATAHASHALFVDAIGKTAISENAARDAFASMFPAYRDLTTRKEDKFKSEDALTAILATYAAIDKDAAAAAATAGTDAPVSVHLWIAQTCGADKNGRDANFVTMRQYVTMSHKAKSLGWSVSPRDAKSLSASQSTLGDKAITKALASGKTVGEVANMAKSKRDKDKASNAGPDSPAGTLAETSARAEPTVAADEDIAALVNAFADLAQRMATMPASAFGEHAPGIQAGLAVIRKALPAAESNVSNVTGKPIKG